MSVVCASFSTSGLFFCFVFLLSCDFTTICHLLHAWVDTSLALLHPFWWAPNCIFCLFHDLWSGSLKFFCLLIHIFFVFLKIQSTVSLCVPCVCVRVCVWFCVYYFTSRYLILMVVNLTSVHWLEIKVILVIAVKLSCHIYIPFLFHFWNVNYAVAWWRYVEYGLWRVIIYNQWEHFENTLIGWHMPWGFQSSGPGV